MCAAPQSASRTQRLGREAPAAASPRHHARRSAARAPSHVLVADEPVDQRCRRLLRCPAPDAGRPRQRMNSAVGPLRTLPPTNGLTATTGARLRAIARTQLADREDRPDRDDRVRGPITIARARRDRLQHLRRRPGSRGAAELDGLDGSGTSLAARLDQELLQRPPAVRRPSRACGRAGRSSAERAPGRRALGHRSAALR